MRGGIPGVFPGVFPHVVKTLGLKPRGIPEGIPGGIPKVRPPGWGYVVGGNFDCHINGPGSATCAELRRGARRVGCAALWHVTTHCAALSTVRWWACGAVPTLALPPFRFRFPLLCRYHEQSDSNTMQKRGQMECDASRAPPDGRGNGLKPLPPNDCRRRGAARRSRTGAGASSSVCRVANV